MSYKHDTHDGAVFIMSSGPSLTFRIWDKQIDTGVVFAMNEWSHVAWSWSSKGIFFFPSFIQGLLGHLNAIIDEGIGHLILK